MTDRKYDVTLYGATGFTGQQTAHYFQTHVGDRLRWAIAGRSPAKLRALQTELRYKGMEVDVVVADSQKPETVDAMVADTGVLLTTAGPFALYGTPVVEACVRHKTDYVDITGEVPWVRDLIDRFHAQASEDGTKIVPLCGFDSIPSDMGAFMVARHLQERHGQGCKSVRAAVTAKGGVNGGTMATARHTAASGGREAYEDVLTLNPADHRSEEERRRSADLTRPRFDEDLNLWLAPWVMAQINTRVVRRSNALYDQLGEGYGPRFTYEEGLEIRGRAAKAKAWGVAGGVKLFEKVLMNPAGRKVVERLAPDPGEGPSEETMDNGFYRLKLAGLGDGGTKVRGEFSGKGDPGNRATVLFVCESALCLAEQRDELPGGAERGGLLTPATAFGEVLLRRLRERGVKAVVEDQ